MSTPTEQAATTIRIGWSRDAREVVLAGGDPANRDPDPRRRRVDAGGGGGAAVGGVQ